MKIVVVIAALYLAGCNTFSNLDGGTNNDPNNSNNGNNQNNTNNVNNSNNQNNSNNVNNVNNVNNETRPFLDDDFSDDWFYLIASENLAVGANNVRLANRPSPGTPLLVLALTDVGDDAVSAWQANKPPDITGSWSGGPLNALAVRPNARGITGFDIIRQRGPTIQTGIVASEQIDINNPTVIGSIVPDIDNLAVRTDIIGDQEQGFTVARVGNEIATKSTIAQRSSVVATQNGIRINGALWDPAASPLNVILRDAILVTQTGALSGTDGSLAWFAVDNNYFTFDVGQLTSDQFFEFVGAAAGPTSIEYVGVHRDADTNALLEEYLVVRANATGMTVELKSDVSLLDIGAEFSINFPDPTVTHIDITTYFHTSDDDFNADDLNPANAIVATIESEGGVRYAAFRAFRITNEAMDMIACRRIIITATIQELSATSFVEGNDVIAAGATLFGADDAMKGVGFNGARFPGLWQPDENLEPYRQPPDTAYDQTCQVCEVFNTQCGQNE